MRIRLPEDVKEWLINRAGRNIRSQTAEITFILRMEMAAEAAKDGSGVSSLQTANPATENHAAAETAGMTSTQY